MMTLAIKVGITDAWYAGALSQGITPEELTQKEKQELQMFIATQYQFLTGFAEFIESQSKENGGKFSTVQSRLALWAQRFNQAFDKGAMMAKLDGKFQWVMGKVKTEHCPDCLKLDGKIKRASVWLAAHLFPQSFDLACHGGCKCRFRSTIGKCTPGRLPQITGM